MTGVDADDLVFAGIEEVAGWIRDGRVTSAGLTRIVLDRIATHDPTLKSYISVTAEAALEAARRADRELKAGHDRGPLHGIPIAVKDLYATKGVPTTFGSPLYADWVPDFDATVVERLRDAGAVILGKTNLHELAYGTTSNNAHYGAVRNPWDTACHPGGSSGGSAAAVAAGLAYLALGSDTGASIRQPAHCCGIVGLKPTFGRVSKFGALPLAWSMDHVGPMTRTVKDPARALQVLAGHDPRDAGSVDRPVPDYAAALDGGVHGLRIGVARAYFFEDCDAEVTARVEAAVAVLRDLGATVVDRDLADMDGAAAAGTVTIASEAAAFHAHDLDNRPEAISEELRATLEVGRHYPAYQYVQAQRLRRRLAGLVADTMADLAAVVMPTSPLPTTPIDDTPPAHGLIRHRNTVPFNLLGLPAISVPCGFTGAGLPVGLQIVGHPFDEETILGIAHAYEQATDWHTRRPPL